MQPALAARLDGGLRRFVRERVPLPVRRSIEPPRRWVQQQILHRRMREYDLTPRPALTPDQREAWERDGCLLLPGFFADERLGEITSLIDRLWQQRDTLGQRTAVDINIGTDRETRVWFSDAPLEARLLPYKLNDLFLEHDLVRRLVLDKRLGGVLADLNEGAPLLCNSITVERSPQHSDHTDTLYMSAPDEEHLVAAWIALEDVHPDAGPLRYWPKSHTIPPYRNRDGTLHHRGNEAKGYDDYMRAELEARGLTPRRLLAKKGDVFLWHGQLYQGDDDMVDAALTRASVVTHYWRARDFRGIHGRQGKGRFWVRRPSQLELAMAQSRSSTDGVDTSAEATPVPSRPVLSAEQRDFWERNGYLVLPAFFEDAPIDAVNALVDDLWARHREVGTNTVVDINIGEPDEARILLSDAPADARSRPYKLNDLFLEHDTVRRVILDARLASVISELNDGAPLVCNSLNFEFGSQQTDHTDTLYMAAPDEVHLVASWIALEDTQPDAGPLRYWPGSHVIPPYRNRDGGLQGRLDEMDAYANYMRAQCAERGLSPERFYAKKGDVFIWHGQLFHGGDRIENAARTRASLVTHYWRASDLGGGHGTLGPGRYWRKRPRQGGSTGSERDDSAEHDSLS